MPRSSACRPVAAFSRPQAHESPYKGDFERRQWFNFANEADTPDATDIYIYDAIGGWFGVYASDFIDQLKAVNTPKITLHINSPGGDVFDAVAIFNALRSHDAEVNVVVDSLAASAASFIAQAGDTVTMNQGSMMMIHDALAMTYGNKADHENTGGILDKISNNIAGIYAMRAGGTDETWREVMQAEAWYTAKEAVAANLADSVSVAKAKDSATNKFDLSIFNFAGRAEAPSPFAVMNHAKEASVSRSANQTGNDQQQSDGQDDGQQDDGQQDDSQTTKPETTQTQTQTETTETDPANQIQNSAASFFMCEGKRVTDPKAVQAHIDSLEGFQRETDKANRENFVKQLAHDNKITASQIDKQTAYALKLTAQGFADWTETWADAPANSMLAKGVGGSGTTNHTGDSVTSKLDNEIEIAKAIVKRHKDSGLAEAALKETPSYKLLVANNAL